MTEEKDVLPFFPIACDVEAGKVYYWCSCSQSKTPPFCDQDNCGKKAVAYKARLTETVYFCNCKLTRDPPFCDGSHAVMLREYLKNKK